MWQVSCALNDQKDSGWKHFHWLFFIQKNTIKKIRFWSKMYNGMYISVYKIYIFWSKLKKKGDLYKTTYIFI